MALTRAQLLAGDTGTGIPVLNGQVQGVRQGVGVCILGDGTLNFEASTALGVMRLNTPNAYNAYAWPVLAGPPAAGTILQSDGAGGVSWVTTNYVPQTVPTAPGTATPNAVIPAGSTADRQTAPALNVGEFRFNSDNDELEVYTSAGWKTVPSSASGNFVQQSIATAPVGATPVAIIPSGTTAQRQTAPAVSGGEIRFNTDALPGFLEMYDGVAWTPVGGGSSVTAATLAQAATGTLNTVFSSPETAVPKDASGMTGAAILPGGTTAQQPGGASDGWFRYNSTLKVLEYYTNSAWLPLVFGGGTTGGVSVQAAAAAPATRPNGAPLQAGDIYYNTTDETLYTYNGTNWIPEVSGGVNIQTSATAPTTRSNGLALAGGDLYYNTATKQYFSWDGTAWVPFDQRNVVVTAVDATVKANDYVVVTAATKTITLPAAPLNGTCVTVVVAGTFLDTVVARGVGTDNIMGLAQDITLDKQYAAMQFTYVSSTSDWRLN